ncbi:two component transcriptional regulator, winged helix family [Nitrosococcus oceani ATCC 19707]|uniref:Two component transcriptional regulator, winged helix family n=1 Tax=Nitrosococcus oceani (strain ATCC 19707 / BCRC 17464 / JCM 30415 / NCIMB 11848 / C-107) TaxID=323261 RepID=Q3JDA1_NITOC|nr:response regulator [Nitrosococcus oceani]ABA57195.1 two component transcriptional regulator, winged helix family [Nitrosococcus oceani ATCC 19707]GEM21512.1 DNA-binding response regulator [Nitrosococcus oceani]
MNRILLADDDIELCGMLKQYLEVEGFQVGMAHGGESALNQARTGGYDLAVLDVMMPQLNGFDVLRELRKDSLVPVLMLTARGEDVDSIIGLELGADDYLPKPCNPRVLVARIRAILRRLQSQTQHGEKSAPPEILKLDDLEVQTGSRTVALNGRPVTMTSTEYSVLEVLLREAGHVVSKAELSERALGRELTRYDRSIDMHLSSLRKKLGPLTNGEERIKTVRGVGYQYTR